MATGSVEELEEERRLLYVACTRARNVLELSWPQRYHHNRKHATDRHGWAQPSRFFSADVRAACDEATTGPPVIEHEAVAVAAGTATASVDALLADLWR